MGGSLNENSGCSPVYSRVLPIRRLRTESESPRARSKPHFSNSSRRLASARAVNWCASSWSNIGISSSTARRARAGHATQANPDRRRVAVYDCNARVGIQQIAHLKISRLGTTGWLRLFFMNGSELSRSNSANHLGGSEVNGSNRTPSATCRIRTRSPSKRNSRGRRTAWLRPLRKQFGDTGLRHKAPPFHLYTRNLYQEPQAQSPPGPVRAGED